MPVPYRVQVGWTDSSCQVISEGWRPSRFERSVSSPPFSLLSPLASLLSPLSTFSSLSPLSLLSLRSLHSLSALPISLSPPHLSYFRSLSLAQVKRSNACTRKLSRAHAQTHTHQVRGRRRMAMAHIPVAKRLLHLPRTARPPAPSSGQQSRFGETACVGCRILLRSAAERVARYRYVAIMPMLKLFYSEQVRWTLSAGGRIRILLTAHAVGRRRRLRKVIQS